MLMTSQSFEVVAKFSGFDASCAGLCVSDVNKLNACCLIMSRDC